MAAPWSFVSYTDKLLIASQQLRMPNCGIRLIHPGTPSDHLSETGYVGPTWQTALAKQPPRQPVQLCESALLKLRIYTLSCLTQRRGCPNPGQCCPVLQPLLASDLARWWSKSTNVWTSGDALPRHMAPTATFGKSDSATTR